MVDAWIICAAVAVVLVLVFLYPSEWSWGVGAAAVAAGAAAVYLEPGSMMGSMGSTSSSGASQAYLDTFTGSYDGDDVEGSGEYSDYDEEYFMGGKPTHQRGVRAPRHPNTKPFTIGLRPNLFDYLKDGSRTVEIRRGDAKMWERHIGHVIVVKKSLAEERQNIKIKAVEHFDSLASALKKHAKSLGGGSSNGAVVEELKAFFDQDSSRMPESGAAGAKYSGGVNVITFEKTTADAPNFSWGDA